MNAAQPMTPDQRRNFRLVQIDALGVGVSNVAGNFLSVFVTRLGASNTQLGLLQIIPSVAGLLFSVAAGRFLQKQRNPTHWFALARLVHISGFALTGLVVFVAPREWAVAAILAIWGLISLPQTLLGVAFTFVMNAVAGPERRYELMSLRWSVLQITTAIGVALVGQILARSIFPLGYQWTFCALSLGGVFSFLITRQIRLPERAASVAPVGENPAATAIGYAHLLRQQPQFTLFVIKRMIFSSGVSLAGPLFSPYWVHVVDAPDSWIGAINTAQLAVMLAGYFVWTRLSRQRGSRFVLLCTTLVVALYPGLTGLTLDVRWILVYAGLAGFCQAGLDLVFFDELMKTIPPEQNATYIALAQTLFYIPGILAPIIGAALADWLGLQAGLLIGAGVRLAGFALFALRGKREMVGV